ncbi:MAG: hypothetical protein KME17_31535 [Cyanosarcina radialis HA8281-LM2]|nr:hypothetical protein [Cyanosarcina radialis HA8281-LM2]
MKVKHNVLKTTQIAMAIGCAAVLAPGAAFAVSPSNVTGRWSATANTSSVVLRITQASNGSISGTFQDFTFPQATNPVTGFYSPVTRRLVFIRLVNGVPTQAYEATVSVDGSDLGGSFNSLNTSGGASSKGVDFNFNARKLSDTP